LAREGSAPERVFLAGNVMIDTIVRILPEADRSLPAGFPAQYALVTLHRPSNVDDPDWLGSLLSCMEQAGHGLEVIFPVEDEDVTVYPYGCMPEVLYALNNATISGRITLPPDVTVEGTQVTAKNLSDRSQCD
jgi:UDP-N-acetylglucosamine 2-epimerase